MKLSMLSCKDVSVLISREQDQKLSGRERIIVRLHLFFCGACSRFSTQVRFIEKAMDVFAQKDPVREDNQEVLSEEARERLRQALNKRHQK
jgi:predicted anti-sigma-YlaC factor YlaD